MNRETEKVIERREFLKDVAKTSVIAVSCLSFGLKEALAQSKVTGKPLLTEKSLEAFILKASSNWRVYQKYTKEATYNLKGFINKHFTLTSEFEKNMNTMSNRDVASFTKIIQQSAVKQPQKGKAPLKVGFYSKGEKIPKASKGTTKACWASPWGMVCVSHTTTPK